MFLIRKSIQLKERIQDPSNIKINNLEINILIFHKKYLKNNPNYQIIFYNFKIQI
jgi:hypothetical protein